MNAPPNIDPVTAPSVSDIVHWLINDSRDERDKSEGLESERDRVRF